MIAELSDRKMVALVIALSFMFPILCCEGLPEYSDADTNGSGIEIEGVVYDRYPTHDEWAMVTGYNGDSDTVNIRETVKLDGTRSVVRIDNGAFHQCSSLKSITMPSVTSIGDNAFSSCSSLESVIMPCVTSIGDHAFGYCHDMVSITLPCVTSIGNDAFTGCDNLESVIMPCVTSIGNSAFYFCSMASVTLPDSLISIGDSAFYNCKQMKSIKIPENVASIGNRTFSSCSTLTDIYVVESNQSFVSKDGVLFKKDMTELITYPAGKRNSTYSVPSYVTSIRDGAFEWSETLTSVTMPNTVVSIGKSAFYDCKKLRSITLPDNLTSIAEYTFWGCEALKSITIPDGVVSIERCAFGGCEALKSITIPDGVVSISDEAFGPDIKFYDAKGNIITNFNELHGFTYERIAEGEFKRTPLLNVFFDTNGGQKINAIHVDDGTSFKLPSPEDRSGFNFVGWLNGDKIYAAGEEVSKTAGHSIRFTALWEPVDPPTDSWNDNAVLIIGGIVAAIAIIGAGAYFYFRTKKHQ